MLVCQVSDNQSNTPCIPHNLIKFTFHTELFKLSLDYTFQIRSNVEWLFLKIKKLI